MYPPGIALDESEPELAAVPQLGAIGPELGTELGTPPPLAPVSAGDEGDYRPLSVLPPDLLGVTPPIARPLPLPPAQPDMNKRRWEALFILAAALGGGRSGAIGAGHGITAGWDREDQQVRLQNAANRADFAIRDRSATADAMRADRETAQRQQLWRQEITRLNQAIKSKQVATPEVYDEAVRGTTAALQQLGGLRINDQMVRQAAPFTAPEDHDLLTTWLDRKFAQGGLKPGEIGAIPQEQVKGTITYTPKAGGPKRAITVNDAIRLTDYPVLIDDATQTYRRSREIAPTRQGQQATDYTWKENWKEVQYAGGMARPTSRGDAAAIDLAADKALQQFKTETKPLGVTVSPTGVITPNETLPRGSVTALHPPGPAKEKFVKVVSRDPITGRTTEQWMPETEAARRGPMEAPASATIQNRVDTAKVIYRIGQEMIAKLDQPQFARVVGPGKGRWTTVKDFWGNPPSEFSDLKGSFHSFSIAAQGLHGMRSAEGARHTEELFAAKYSPENLKASIRAMSQFAQYLLEEEGVPLPELRTAASTAPPVVSEPRKTKSGLPYTVEIR